MDPSSSSISGSSKRAKAPGNSISQVAHCLVDGCNADLNLCRDYHRRHKVCEVHSKTAKVTIGGREQRFCQQCSRFHSLVEFDEGKRSCRKRLDGHNRRRRKPQPDILTRNNNSPLVLSAQQSISGPRLLSFNSPQILPSMVVSSSWSNIIKPENESMMYNHQHHMSFNSSSFKGVPNNQIQFLQGDNNNLDPTTNVVSPEGLSRHQHHHQVVVDSDRALSLLSSGPTTLEFSLTHVVRPEQQHQQPLVVNSSVNDLHHYNNSSSMLGQYSFGQESGNKTVVVSGAEESSHGSSSSNVWSTLNFPGMFHQHEGEGSSASSTHPTLTFMWE